MANRFYSQSEHDNVIAASANSYSQLTQQGYNVTTNPGSQKNRYVGQDPTCYPDVIVWRPNPYDPNSGQAIIIEEIETAESVNFNSIAQWKEYANLGVSKFILIVPRDSVQIAFNLVQSYDISVTEIWYYTIQNHQIFFEKYFSFK